MTTYAIFKVTGATKGFKAGTGTVCEMKYVRLTSAIDRDSAVEILAGQIHDECEPAAVEFMFWADTWSSNGGSGIDLTPNFRLEPVKGGK